MASSSSPEVPLRADLVSRGISVAVLDLLIEHRNLSEYGLENKMTR
jgi:hypothetical protein